ncbi:MAG: hypothetical protein IRY83_17925, partial [Chloroflexi bacterium]|nr:hypothetical protein [Chloroflexota bacterium]
MRSVPAHPMLLKLWVRGTRDQRRRKGERYTKNTPGANTRHSLYIAEKELAAEMVDDSLLPELEAAEEAALAESGTAPDPEHAKYLAERPRSEGLFGPDPLHPPALADVVAELRAKTDQDPVWKAVSYTKLRSHETLRQLV